MRFWRDLFCGPPVASPLEARQETRRIIQERLQRDIADAMDLQSRCGVSLVIVWQGVYDRGAYWIPRPIFTEVTQ